MNIKILINKWKNDDLTGDELIDNHDRIIGYVSELEKRSRVHSKALDDISDVCQGCWDENTNGEALSIVRTAQSELIK